MNKGVESSCVEILTAGGSSAVASRQRSTGGLGRGRVSARSYFDEHFAEGGAGHDECSRRQCGGQRSFWVPADADREVAEVTRRDFIPSMGNIDVSDRRGKTMFSFQRFYNCLL